MNSTSELFAKIGSFFGALIDFFVTVFWWIYYIFAFIFGMIGNALKSIYVPLLPTKTRIFSEPIVSGTILILFVVFVIIINISVFKLYKKDKLLSQNQPEMTEKQKKRYVRVSEKKLLLRCILGGAIGAFAGMKLLRHKTLKPKFNIIVTAMLIIQLLVYSMVLGYFGFWLCFA